MISMSVIVPWHNRPELMRTLQDNSDGFAAIGADVIVVNCGNSCDRFYDCLPGHLGMALRWVKIPAAEFNKGLALNVGASLSKRDALFLLDADIIIGRDTLKELAQSLKHGLFVTVASVVESGLVSRISPQHVAIDTVTHVVELTAGGNTHRIVTNRLDLKEGARAGPGLTLVYRSDFLSVNGMNSGLTGWGWDDLDLIARLQMALGLRRREAGSVVHLSHPESSRQVGALGRGDSDSKNFLQCLTAYSLGDLNGTYYEDLASVSPEYIITIA